MGDATAPPQPLRELLAARRRFVGRAAELELVRAALESAEPPFSVLYLHGPGGIGKSCLLDVVAGLAARSGATVVRLDGRDIAATPSGVSERLGEALDVPPGDGPITVRADDGPTPGAPRRIVLLIDSYERLTPVAGWIRSVLLPRLPSTALTVIAARSAPDPAWRADHAWGDLLRVVSLRNFTPEESVELLRALGVPQEVHEPIRRATHGHPLGLSLLADIVLRGGDASLDPLPPDIVGVLVNRFLAMVPTDGQRRALEVCAVARVTTESLLRDALGLADAHQVFGWLRELSFVGSTAEGLHPHDLARDVLDADLRWRDPDGYRAVFHGVWRHIRGRLRGGGTEEQRQAILDLKFAYRNLPGTPSPIDWQSWGEAEPEPATAGDRPSMLDLVRTWEGAESAELAARWLDRQPEGFFVLRHDDGSVRGVLGLLDLTRAAPEDVARDPGTRAAWAHAQRHAATRPHETVTQTRFVIDRQAYQDPSPTLNAAPVLTMQRYLRTPSLSWDFLTLAEPDRWNAYFAVGDLPRVDGADFVVGGRTFGLFAHDFRQVPVDAWLDLVTERGLSRDVRTPPRPTAPEVMVLSQPDFEQAVRQGLRDLHDPVLLGRNPLVRTRVARDSASPAAPDGRALQVLLRSAVASLGERPRDDKLFRAVDRTFLRAAGTQEAAAARLGLPFSTYRRHLTQGVGKVVAWLWERELYGVAEQQ